MANILAGIVAVSISVVTGVIIWKILSIIENSGNDSGVGELIFVLFLVSTIASCSVGTEIASDQKRETDFKNCLDKIHVIDNLTKDDCIKIKESEEENHETRPS